MGGGYPSSWIFNCLSLRFDGVQMANMCRIIMPNLYRAMLCIRGTSHGPVSVHLSVCHKSEFY